MEELRVDNCPKNDDVVEDDDDRPMLSSQALAALQEFFAEQTQAVETDRTETESETVTLVSEDWRLSQFWYDAETAETVAKEVVSLCGGADSDCRVACIACPTLYAYLKKIGPDVSAQLLEFDKRFEQYGTDFTFYDYNLPEDLPLELKHTFSIIVADPPYLSKECLEKVSQTTSFLARPGSSYLLLLTGLNKYLSIIVSDIIFGFSCKLILCGACRNETRRVGTRKLSAFFSLYKLKRFNDEPVSTATRMMVRWGLFTFKLQSMEISGHTNCCQCLF
ncbi:hypothetical protein Q3G72_013312 [Acer saccharum]|nr:hypothetical protein Q3G72_013312 [Acer saccharum]